jgi:hypothetical protein
MAEYTYIFSAGKLSSGSPLPPFFTFGDVAVFNLTFGSGELQDGDRLTVAIDSNMEFFDPLSATGDASVMAVAHEDIDSEYDGASVQVEVPLNTDVFRQRVNGRENPLLVHVGIYRLRGEAYSEIGKLSGYAFPVVAGPNTVTPVLPVTDYPTRQEADALVGRAERAAGRAEQAAAGIVPPLQLDSPPTTSTVGSVGQLATWHDSENNTDHLYHLVFISTSDSATLYHWEECVLVSMGNVAGGYPVLDANGKVAEAQLPLFSNAPEPIIATTAPTTSTVGVLGQLYVNTTTSKTYHCTAITNTGTESEPVWSYTWTDDINAKGGTLQGALKYITGTWQVGLQQYAIVCCASPNNITTGSIISGYHPTGTQAYQIVCGQYNTSEAGAFIVGNGTTAQQTSNALVLKNNGNLYIAGGHQQGITVIPAATTAYTLVEGVQSHTPEAASVYTLPAITGATRTHECILTIKFSASVLTYEFQDSAGNTLVPLPLNGDIEAGSVVTFLCRYNSLLSQWVIMPVMDGKEAQE